MTYPPQDADTSHVPHDWTPGSPALRGEDKGTVPDDWTPTHTPLLDELPHRTRNDRGLVNDEPDPGYDPDSDDQRPARHNHDGTSA